MEMLNLYRLLWAQRRRKLQGNCIRAARKKHIGSHMDSRGLYIFQKKKTCNGCSVDCLLQCKCKNHDGSEVVEIKWAHSDREKHPKEVALSKGCVQEADGHTRLSENSDFYHQIQGQIGISGYNFADLVIYTKQGIHVVEGIAFNQPFLAHLSRRLEWAIVIAHRPSSVRRKLFAFSTSSLKPLNGIQQNLTGSKISTPSTKFVFFGPIGKTRWPPWPLIGWDVFDFSSETAERNSMKLDKNQYLNTLYQVCVFRADRKNKMAALASWLAETFSTSPLKPLNGIQRNLTESKIATPSTKFVFFGPIGKTR